MRQQFLSKHSRSKSIKGGVFSTVKEAKEMRKRFGDDLVTDSTLGVLFDEEGKMVTFKSVWDSYEHLERTQKAAYAESMVGNKEFLEAVDRWVFQGVKKEFYTNVIASAGGSGAISNTIWNYLDAGETLLIPEIAWGAYSLMAEEFSLEVAKYKLFNDRDEFNIESFIKQAEKIMEKQGKVFAIINDPCHNPTGYSMTVDEWKEVIAALNILSEKGPVILLNDIAYLDFSSKSLEEARRYMNVFNDISDNLLVIQTFSLSKSFTCYGLRVGAQIGISKNREVLESFKDANEFSCRAKWSNVSNGGMAIMPYLLERPELVDSYRKEREKFTGMIGERGNVFFREATDCNLPLYPYSEGFFATVKIEKEFIEDVHSSLKKELIYTIKLPVGIRIALCCLPKKKVEGLAFKIKEVMERVETRKKLEKEKNIEKLEGEKSVKKVG